MDNIYLFKSSDASGSSTPTPPPTKRPTPPPTRKSPTPPPTRKSPTPPPTKKSPTPPPTKSPTPVPKPTPPPSAGPGPKPGPGPGPDDCGGMNFESGIASISQYDAAGGGTFGVNQQTSHCQSAMPYRLFTPKSSGNNKAFGKCPTGLSASPGVMPTYKNKPLCYSLTNLTNKKKLTIQVTETCGGNCGYTGLNDCATKPGDDTMYDSKNRAYPAQLCSPMPAASLVNWSAGTISGAGADPKAKYSTPEGTCVGNPAGHVDWCSGLYAHFDLGTVRSASFYTGTGCSDGTLGQCIGIASYKRVDC